MSVRVRIPEYLRSAVGHEWVEAKGATAGEVLASLQGDFPELQAQLLDDSGLRRYVNVYVNERNIRFAEGLSTAVEVGDTVMILPAERPRMNPLS